MGDFLLRKIGPEDFLSARYASQAFYILDVIERRIAFDGVLTSDMRKLTGESSGDYEWAYNHMCVCMHVTVKLILYVQIPMILTNVFHIPL